MVGVSGEDEGEDAGRREGGGSDEVLVGAAQVDADRQVNIRVKLESLGCSMGPSSTTRDDFPPNLSHGQLVPKVGTTGPGTIK